MCKIISTAITLGISAVIGYVVWVYVGKPDTFEEFQELGKELWERGGEVLKDLTDFDFGTAFDGEPSLGNNETMSWTTRNGGAGLRLKLLNNLDETWQEEFFEAVNNWMSSDPQILILETEKITDWESGKCDHKDGVMMVCNDNYGDNGMLGVNEIMSSQGIIQSSIAMMNEFYLHNGDQPERLYTMCHEVRYKELDAVCCIVCFVSLKNSSKSHIQVTRTIDSLFSQLGHGFGLPHTDENPYNKDLGNCMDYTNTPKNNMFPDSTNFARLQELYGQVSRRLRRRNDAQSLPSSILLNGRSGSEFSAELMRSYKDAMMNLENEIRGGKPANGSQGWRKLSAPRGGTRYERTLVDDFKLEVHILHPLN